MPPEPIDPTKIDNPYALAAYVVMTAVFLTALGGWGTWRTRTRRGRTEEPLPTAEVRANEIEKAAAANGIPTIPLDTFNAAMAAMRKETDRKIADLEERHAQELAELEQRHMQELRELRQEMADRDRDRLRELTIVRRQNQSLTRYSSQLREDMRGFGHDPRDWPLDLNTNDQETS